jgi:predicted amidohydrolase YtcJ
LNDLHFRTDLGDNLLKIGPIKATADGAISSRTAYLSEPYNGDPDDYGDLRMTQDELDEFVLAGHKAGWQVAVHANGDATIEMVLDAFEKALQKHPREDHRHRIEHCTVVNEDILRRIKELNLVVNPFSTYLYQHGEKMVDYGERASMMFAHGSFLKHNIPVSGTTDNPAGLLNPLLGIQTMVTRKTNEGDVIGSEQRISVEEALRIYTMGSAYSRFEEQSKGSITPGKLADFVVLSANPTTVDPSSISDINVERTYMGGDCVYSTN